MATLSSAPIQRPGVISLSLQEALWLKLEATGSNIAHANDTAFKKFITETHEVKMQAADHTNISYTETQSAIDFSPGTLKKTHNEFDVALSGPGFFAFQTADNGVVYSRDGQLSQNAQGVLTSILGDPILSAGGSEITIPPTAKFVTIAKDGTVATESGILNKIGVKDFADKRAMTKVGQGYFYTEEKGTAIEAPYIQQGFIEASNVNTVGEILTLVEIARLFENAQKILEDDTKRQNKAINISPSNA